MDIRPLCLMFIALIFGNLFKHSVENTHAWERNQAIVVNSIFLCLAFVVPAVLMYCGK